MRHPAKTTLPILLALSALAGCTINPSPDTPISTLPLIPSAPPPTLTPAPTLQAGAPNTITIPTLDTTAPITGPCPTLNNGTIEPPDDIHLTCTVGRPDTDITGTGTTLITSHTTRDPNTTGALEHINQLHAGDTLTTGNTHWTITQTATYPANQLPPALFTNTGPRLLILGTCHLTPAIQAGAPYTDTDLAIATPNPNQP